MRRCEEEGAIHKHIQWLISIKLSHYPVPCGITIICCTIDIVVVFCTTDGLIDNFDLYWFDSIVWEKCSTKVVLVVSGVYQSIGQGLVAGIAVVVASVVVQGIIIAVSCHSWETDTEL